MQPAQLNICSLCEAARACQQCHASTGEAPASAALPTPGREYAALCISGGKGQNTNETLESYPQFGIVLNEDGSYREYISTQPLYYSERILQWLVEDLRLEEASCMKINPSSVIDHPKLAHLKRLINHQAWVVWQEKKVQMPHTAKVDQNHPRPHNHGTKQQQTLGNSSARSASNASSALPAEIPRPSKRQKIAHPPQQESTVNANTSSLEPETSILTESLLVNGTGKDADMQKLSQQVTKPCASQEMELAVESANVAAEGWGGETGPQDKTSTPGSPGADHAIVQTAPDTSRSYAMGIPGSVSAPTTQDIIAVPFPSTTVKLFQSVSASPNETVFEGQTQLVSLLSEKDITMSWPMIPVNTSPLMSEVPPGSDLKSRPLRLKLFRFGDSLRVYTRDERDFSMACHWPNIIFRTFGDYEPKITWSRLLDVLRSNLNNMSVDAARSVVFNDTLKWTDLISRKHGLLYYSFHEEVNKRISQELGLPPLDMSWLIRGSLGNIAFLELKVEKGIQTPKDKKTERKRLKAWAAEPALGQ